MATTYDPTTADAGTVQKIDRTKIIIDPNVRKDIRLDKSFISSIRVRGFEQLPTGYLDDDGIAHITIGQRRISAALEIGWPVIPMIIKPKVEAEADRVEELRLLAQIAENEQRVGFTDAELAAGYKQLAMVGITEEQIARKTNQPKTRITTALAVVGSETASKALQSKPITLEQAAVFLEFEDNPEAVKQLNQVVSERPEQLDHLAERLRRDRVLKAAVDQLVTKLEVDGWQVIRSQYSYGYTKPAGGVLLRDLHREDDAKKTPLKPADVAGLSGRVAVVFPRFGADADAEYFIKKPEKHGLASHAYSASSGKGPLTDEEKAARRQKRQDKADMLAATEVRRNWIADALTHKKLPTEADVWIAHAFLQTHMAVGIYQRDTRARELAASWIDLELDPDRYGNSNPGREGYQEYIEAHRSDAGRIALAYAIALVEDIAGDPKHPWFGQSTQLAPYLLQLQAWGYTLADVEQRIVDAASKKEAAKR